MNQKNSPMTLNDNPFKFVLPLQHMAKVKTVEVLWRNSVNRHELKHLYAISQLSSPHYQPMMESLGKNVEELLVPEAIKNELKVFVSEMVRHALNWLLDITEDSGANGTHKNYAAIVSYFIDNFSWDNIGLVDGKKMLESYVSNKETIDFNTWRMLCDYCIKDDIVRLGKTIDWRNCQSFMCSSPHSIYWYWRIYRKLPTKEMFSLDREYSKFEDLYYDSRRWQFDKNKIIKMMLNKSLRHWNFPAGLTAIRYFQSQRKYEAQWNEIFSISDVFMFQLETSVYMLGQMKDAQAWLRHFFSSGGSADLLSFSAYWPWNMFSDQWMNILEDINVLPVHFFGIFDNMCRGIRMWNHYKLKESQYKVLRNRTVYQRFKELWALFTRKFGMDNDSARRTSISILGSNDITFSKILFDEVESSQRIDFLKSLRDFAQKEVMSPLSDSDFCTNFQKEVLQSDEEREIFLEIVSCLRRR